MAALVGASLVLLGLPVAGASAASEIARAEASADWSEASVAGSASWPGCQPSLKTGAGCSWTAFVTIAPGTDAAECSAPERQWPHASGSLALAWEGRRHTAPASDAFDVSAVRLSGSPGQLACLSVLETVEERPECTSGTVCPAWIAIVPHYSVLASALLTAPSPPPPTGPPSIVSESVSGLTATDATLEAEIDPGGLETRYRFRLAYGCGFGLEACPAFCVTGQPCPGPWNSVITVPLADAVLAVSSGPQLVRLDLADAGLTLQPYKYRYSVEATNAAGTVVGPDQLFWPPAAEPAPAPAPEPQPEGEPDPESEPGPVAEPEQQAALRPEAEAQPQPVSGSGAEPAVQAPRLGGRPCRPGRGKASHRRVRHKRQLHRHRREGRAAAAAGACGS